MKKLHLNIISPEKQLFEGDILSVRLPGAKGTFSILPGHAPIVSSLVEGTLIYVTESDKQIHQLEIHGGFIELSNDTVSVCIS